VIVAIVRFPLDPPLPAGDARAMFEAGAPAYQKLPGLLRKHYLRAEDGATAGGVYLWESRAAAEAVYDDDWFARLTAKYGAPPTVEYFESPVTVDPDRITVE
jgi:hypothetical protein